MDQEIPDKIKHPDSGNRIQDKEVILVTGSSGLIGYNLIKKLSRKYRVVGLDRLGPPYPPLQAECVNFDITDRKSIASAMERIRYGYGNRLSSVIHLAAYYNFSKKEDPLYDIITVKGTENLLTELQDFEIEQFVFTSTNLVYKPTTPGNKQTEESPLEGNWGYPASKIITENLLKQKRGSIPVSILRVAGVYTDYGDSIPITNQIKRIYEKQLKSHFYSGDLDHGDVFIHLDDLLNAIEKTIDHRAELPDEVIMNIGEPSTPSYQELQDTIGLSLYNKKWKTQRIPLFLAKAGAWFINLFGDSFIKPWMIDKAGEHYEMNISRANKYINWEPEHRLLDSLPGILEKLKDDPKTWFEEHLR